MYFELKSVNVWTMIKTWFFLNFVIGLGLGVIYSMISLFTLTAATELLVMQGIDPSVIDPFTLMLLTPLFFACGNAVFGTMFVAVLSIVYNITGRLFGGLQFEMIPDEDDEETAATASINGPGSVAVSARSAAPAPAPAPPRPVTPDPETGYMPPPPPPPPVEQAQAIREASKTDTPPPPPASVPVRPKLDDLPDDSAAKKGDEDDTDPMIKLGPAPPGSHSTAPPPPPSPPGPPAPPPERAAPEPPEKAEKETNSPETGETSEEDKRRNDQS